MRIGLLAPSRRYEDSFLRPAEALFAASGDNLGNFAFVEALWRHLSPNATILPFHAPVGEAREKCDMLVLAAANQLGAHTDLAGFAAHLERIGLPIVVVGLGAQAPHLAAPVALSPGTERWARVLAGLAPTARPNIGLRGEFTRRVMERLGLGDRVTTLGCPSNFLNDAPDFYRTLKRNCERDRIDRLAALAGSRHFAGVRDIERRLARLVGDSGGLIVVQADLEMLRWARGEAAANETEAIRAYLAPDRTPRRSACFASATPPVSVTRPRGRRRCAASTSSSARAFTA